MKKLNIFCIIIGIICLLVAGYIVTDKILIKEDYIRIKTAIELRTKENNMWDKLFDGQTQSLTQKFLKELNRRNITKNKL